jgi:hypothetical protein
VAATAEPHGANAAILSAFAPLHYTWANVWKGDPVCRIAFFIRLNLTSPLPKVVNAKSLIPLP